MRCSVQFLMPHGASVVLEPGDLVGRTPRASLRLDDPRVSELHAYVSLRGGQLLLLALRGRMTVYGKPATEVVLAPGTRIVLAGAFPIVVEKVELPELVLALEAPGLETTPVCGVTSIGLEPGPTVFNGFRDGAAAVAWCSEGAVRLRLRGELDRSLAPGDAFEIDGVTFTVELVALDQIALPATENAGHLTVPLEIVIFYDAVHIVPADGRAVIVDGIVARVVSELAEVKVPVEWHAVARTIWPNVEGAALRSRWDQSMHRLRRKLREGRIRMDLVRASHGGLYELYLGPRDVVKNRS